jgi:hypothetical protein
MAHNQEDSFFLELEKACRALSVADGRKSVTELHDLFIRLRDVGVDDQKSNADLQEDGSYNVNVC